MKKALLLISCFVLVGISVSAQSDADIQKLFSMSDKQDHQSYMLNKSNTGDSYYWINKDTLFSCNGFIGSKIALADIDFSKKDIAKNDMLVKGTKNPVYEMKFYASAGKTVYGSGCFMGDLPATGKPDTDPVTMDMASEELANQAFDFLKKQAEQKDNGVTFNFDVLQTVKELTDFNNAMSARANPELSSLNSFDAQFLTLINGLKDYYKSLQGAPVPGKDLFESKVPLDGAVSTRIHRGLVANDHLEASFGEFATLDEALPVYKKAVEQINNSKGVPVVMIQQDEKKMDDDGRFISWIPFDVGNKLDPALKGFGFSVSVYKTRKIDRQLNISNVYAVELTIAK